MLNPVVLLPLPLALLLLTLVAYAAARYLDSLPVFPDWNVAPQPRHRLTNAPTAYRPRSWDAVTAEAIPISAPPAPPAPFDPLDHRVPLAEVERWGSIPDDWYQPLLDPEITETPDWTATELWSQAVREGWARNQVAAAGESWDTHMAKFSGAVVPREDTRELATIA